MSEAAIIALIQFGVRFGLDSVIALAPLFGRRDVTVDEVIAAFEKAKTKTAHDYLREDREQNHPGGG